jgi:hypothetical protein
MEYFDIRLYYFYLTNVDILQNQQYVVMCFYTLLQLLKSVHQLVRTLVIFCCYHFVPHKKNSLPYKDQTFYLEEYSLCNASIVRDLYVGNSDFPSLGFSESESEDIGF